MIGCFVTTTATQAYITTGQDSVVSLANGWSSTSLAMAAQANFNARASLTVQIDLADGTTAKPVCKANDGTTGETNDLDLGACKAKKGTGIALPYGQFVESLPK